MHVNLTWRRYKAICLVYLYPPKNIPNGDRSQRVIHDIHARKTFYTIYPPKNIPNCSSGQCTVHDILVRTYLILSLYPPMDMTNGHNSQCMIPDIHVLISRRSSKKLSNGSMSQRSICDNYVRTLISLPSKEYYNRPQLMSVYDSWHPYWQILCHISLPIKKNFQMVAVFSVWFLTPMSKNYLISLPTKEYFKQPQQSCQCLIRSLHPCKTSYLSYLSTYQRNFQTVTVVSVWSMTPKQNSLSYYSAHQGTFLTVTEVIVWVMTKGTLEKRARLTRDNDLSRTSSGFRFDQRRLLHMVTSGRTLAVINILSP